VIQLGARERNGADVLAGREGAGCLTRDRNSASPSRVRRVGAHAV